MRHLLNTLYVFTEDAYLMLDGENVVVRRDGAELGRVPLHTLEGILCFSYRGASPALMGACVERGVGLSFFDRKGRFLAGAYGEQRGNVLLRKRSMHGLKTPKRALLSLGISLWESPTTVVGCSNGRCATMGCVLIRDR